MTAKRHQFPCYPVWPTVVFLIVLALVGGGFWTMVSFGANSTAIMASGPFAWITLGPPMIAVHVSVATLGACILPIWSIIGGQLFTNNASHSAARQMGVTFFSDTHPIARVTQRLAETMGLPRVAHIGWFPNEDINAFAMGDSPSNALIAVSKGAVERLTKEQLVAVIGHELGHVASNDMARMTRARSIQESLTFFLLLRGLKTFARWVFTPLSELEILRLSRAREFTADEISAIVFSREHMISALERLKKEKKPPQTNGFANVMMWAGLGEGHLFSTHPSLEMRIARLKTLQMAKEPEHHVNLGRQWSLLGPPVCVPTASR
ncbi:M48 family metalloprotease [Nitratireductor sp. StC3]|uniref:M48 family metalloprotease n=1 Tax=Nitratireductor sp. StC3 TaxID=2126741 RepID=UPI000D0CEF67|nr:M48 family metalloprotease [Nitratireductor sp. StC3]PSM19831.1 hypothetical protein C7T96_01800 [Nitratireductor sp. StC3]